MSKIYGYVRVSSNEQNEIRQVLAKMLEKGWTYEAYLSAKEMLAK